MYSIPEQAKLVFQNGILSNPLMVNNLPKNADEYGGRIRFEGTNSPSMPINWRFAESISAIKGLEAVMLLALLERKYGVKAKEVLINTDHAQLFVMSTLLWTIDPDGKTITATNSVTSVEGAKDLASYFPSYDKHRQQSTHHRASCTNIYKTKDERFFHLHASMNPDPSLDSIQLPYDLENPTVEESWKLYMDKIAQIDSREMQRLSSDVYKQAGIICWTTDEYKNSENYRANAHVGLFEIREHPNPVQRATWWPETAQTSCQRPMAGLKVLDITRVIAAPAITRGLAELGASVMRVTAPHLADYSSLHCDLNWGKWNCHLDFRQDEDCKKLRELILQADVVVTGYRPGVLDKWGLGEDAILALCAERERGIIYVRENCYGWHGPWAYRSGWQQISDACCGVSMEFGRAMGNDEPVTPILPNSDYCTGVAGVAGILRALMLRAEKGGSYSVDVALNYYSQWLVNSCGTYPKEVWDEVWTKNGRPVFRHYHNMNYIIPRFAEMLKKSSADTLFKDDFFEVRDCESIGTKIKTVKPVLRFPGGEVDLVYNVGTRSNGVDQPHWPKDLMVEMVPS